MKEIRLNNGMVAIVDDEDYEYLSQRKWFYRSGYAECKFLGKAVKMHTVIMGKNGGAQIDHKNRNPLDNRKSNLRFCTASQNAMNRKVRKDSKTGYKGVTKKPWGWTARIKLDGKRMNLGTYRTARDAAIAYNEKAVELFGEFANVNKIES